MTRKPILCLDFDGVIHSYTSGWQGADVVSDPPVPGAMTFIDMATEHFTVAIYSSRSSQRGGIRAMRFWLRSSMRQAMGPDRTRCNDVLAEIYWPTEKPPAMVSIDDRALTFTGVWPTIDSLLAFQPWNKRDLSWEHRDVSSSLAPCPFCKGTNIDAEGWVGKDKDGNDRSGPACDDCGGSADTVELWNASAAQ